MSSENSSAAPASPLTIWAMTSGAPGMQSQVIGLAEAITTGPDDRVVSKTISLKKWAKLLPGHLNPAPFTSLAPGSDSISPPWPDILITSGRRTSGISIAIGRASGGTTYRIHLQNPQTPPRHFDLIVSMRHDELDGPNVLQTKTALHKLTATDLASAKTDWQSRLINDPAQPVLGVILGGKNKAFGFTPERTAALISLLQTTIAMHAPRILITPSHRTETFVMEQLQAAFKDHPDVWIWDETGDNPYKAILALSDHLLVTADSVSMISESLFTGTPVHIFELNGTSRRHRIFLDILQQDQLTHMIDDKIDFSVDRLPQPVDETARIAQIIRQNHKEHAKGHAK